jgi:hypothetical protein
MADPLRVRMIHHNSNRRRGQDGFAGWQNEDRWSEADEAMIALETFLRPHIKEIKRNTSYSQQSQLCCWWEPPSLTRFMMQPEMAIMPVFKRN